MLLIESDRHLNCEEEEVIQIFYPSLLRGLSTKEVLDKYWDAVTPGRNGNSRIIAPLTAIEALDRGYSPRLLHEMADHLSVMLSENPDSD